MKNDYTLLSLWLPIMVFGNAIYAFCSGIPHLFAQFLFPDSPTVGDLLSWILGTVSVGIALCFCTYKYTFSINSRNTPASLGTPIFNIISASVLYVIIFIFTKDFILPGMKIGYLIGMVSQSLCELQNGGSEGSYQSQLGCCILQTCIFAAASLAVCIITKNKQDSKRKEREKREKAAKNDSNISTDKSI